MQFSPEIKEIIRILAQEILILRLETTHNPILLQLPMGRIIILRIFKVPRGETGNPREGGGGVEGEEAEVGEAEARAEYRKEILLSRKIQDVH